MNHPPQKRTHTTLHVRGTTHMTTNCRLTHLPLVASSTGCDFMGGFRVQTKQGIWCYTVAPSCLHPSPLPKIPDDALRLNGLFRNFGLDT